MLTPDRPGLLRELSVTGPLFVGTATVPFPAVRPLPTGPAWSRMEIGSYRLRLAATEEDRLAACRLRFEVFNLELGEGLAISYETGLDQDRFDMVCDHLLIEHRSETETKVVGTYRLQSGEMAKRHFGYYSAREFDLSPFEQVRPQVLELGRASIASEHRTSEVLTLLWRGITQYARHYGLRYLLGCSSLGTTDNTTGWAVYQQLHPFLAREEFRTHPVHGYKLPVAMHTDLPVSRIPKLLKTYLAVGSRICGPPALDAEFGTIDFLTLMDLEEMSAAAKARFF